MAEHDDGQVAREPEKHGAWPEWLAELIQQPEEHATWPDVAQTLVTGLGWVAVVAIIAWASVNGG